MLPPLAFSDEEMDTLSALASALTPHARDAFLRLVANKLAGYPPELRGPGLVHRLATEAQRGFLNVAVGAARARTEPQCWQEIWPEIRAACLMERIATDLLLCSLWEYLSCFGLATIGLIKVVTNVAT